MGEGVKEVYFPGNDAIMHFYPSYKNALPQPDLSQNDLPKGIGSFDEVIGRGLD
jgi:hypothetical protein